MVGVPVPWGEWHGRIWQEGHSPLAPDCRESTWAVAAVGSMSSLSAMQITSDPWHCLACHAVSWRVLVSHKKYKCLGLSSSLSVWSWAAGRATAGPHRAGAGQTSQPQHNIILRIINWNLYPSTTLQSTTHLTYCQTLSLLTVSANPSSVGDWTGSAGVLLVLVQPPQQSVAVRMADPPQPVADDPTTTMTYQVLSSPLTDHPHMSHPLMSGSSSLHIPHILLSWLIAAIK